MFRTFQTRLDGNGNGSIDLSPYIESVEWDIYQISVQTNTFDFNCIAEIHHNGFFLCGSTQGSKDTATGPPDCVVQPKDTFTIMWSSGPPNGYGNLGVWYNEKDRKSVV